MHSLYITRECKLFHSPVNNIWQEKSAVQNRAFVVSDVPWTLGEEHKDQVKRRLVPALKSLALHNAVLHSARHWLQTSRSLRPSASILFHPTMHL